MTHRTYDFSCSQLVSNAGIGLKTDQIGCRVQLNPNGSDLRCGDKVNHVNWNQNEGAIQLCEMCQLKKRNASLLEMLNRRVTQ